MNVAANGHDVEARGRELLKAELRRQVDESAGIERKLLAAGCQPTPQVVDAVNAGLAEAVFLMVWSKIQEQRVSEFTLDWAGITVSREPAAVAHSAPMSAPLVTMPDSIELRLRPQDLDRLEAAMIRVVKASQPGSVSVVYHSEGFVTGIRREAQP